MRGRRRESESWRWTLREDRLKALARRDLRSAARVEDRSPIRYRRANRESLANQFASRLYLRFRRAGFLHSSPFSPFLLSPSATMSEPEHLRMTYNEIHKLIRASAEKIAEFKPDTLIAIGESSRDMSRRSVTDSILCRWRASDTRF